jgi:hypothetical protein
MYRMMSLSLPDLLATKHRDTALSFIAGKPGSHRFFAKKNGAPTKRTVKP